jgi:hypothetical protein
MLSAGLSAAFFLKSQTGKACLFGKKNTVPQAFPKIISFNPV